METSRLEHFSWFRFELLSLFALFRPESVCTCVCEEPDPPQWNMTSIITVLLRFNTELIQTDRCYALLYRHTSTLPPLLRRVCNFVLFHVCFGCVLCACVCVHLCVRVLPVLGESREDVIENREGVTGGLQLCATPL